MEYHNYITQISKGKNNVWQYLLGVLVIFLGVFVGAAPYSLFLRTKVLMGELDGFQIQDLNYVFQNIDKNVVFFFMMLSFVFGVFAIYITVKFIHKRSFKTIITSRAKVDYKRILFSFLIWGSIIIGLTIIDLLLFSSESYIFQLEWKPFLILLLLSLVLIPFQIGFEELLFRGYLMQGLGLASKTKWFPLVFTSLVFGLMHISNPEVGKLGYGIMVIYIGMGLFLGLITLLDEGMELALGFHAANNFFTALLVTADWTAFQTYSIFKDVSEPNLTMEIIAVFVLLPILLFFFHKKYRFTNWKKKLL